MNNYDLKVSGNIADLKNRTFIKGTIFIKNGKIIKIVKTKNVVEKYILPGLIDSHVHIESSMLIPSEFAKIAVRHGTVGVVSDPHEIANVMGIKGIDLMIKNGKKVTFKFYFGAPSCVPATNFETSGYNINPEEIENLLKSDNIFFLSEMMNFPGVIYKDKEVHEKLNLAKKYNKKIDGHAPGLSGENLKKYINTGITTDHECFSKKEALEKIKLGMKIQIREGSAAKNFKTLYELIDEYPEKVMLCTDDSHPDDLLKGHINNIIKSGIKKNVDFFNLLQAATLNPIKHYNLDVGLLQKNDPADFIVVDDLKSFNILETYIDGKLVFKNGKSFIETIEEKEINNFKRTKIINEDIKIKNKKHKKIKVIEIVEGELITKKISVKPKTENNFIVTDIVHDILKIVVASRYDNSKPSIGFVKNFGLKNGAIASSIAHDSHNIIAVGTNDKDIIKAINKIIELKGGIVACNKNEIEFLKLNVAGIMSNSSCEIVAEKYCKLNSFAYKLGAKLKAPFMTLSFMALLVIPELKIGDKGLFDVNKFNFTSIFE
ncbi:MAG: adenine deaminase [Bacteroidales bacterium]|nr:adenine deaminase [Bacteroidales bacterium]